MHWPRWCNRRRSWGFRSGGGGDGDGDAVPEVRGASGGLVGGVQGEAGANSAAHPLSDLQFGVRPGAVVAGPGAGAVVVEVPGSRPVVELAVGDADDGQVRKGHGRPWRVASSSAVAAVMPSRTSRTTWTGMWVAPLAW